MDQDTIEGVVLDQIEHPRETDPSSPDYMPPMLVEGQDAKDVATYVGEVAGVPGIEPPTAPGGPGGQVFANNGCGSCHTFAAAQSAGTVGPDLDEGLQGQSVKEIEQSIVDPNAKITQGFQPNIMPENYEQTIDPKDLKLLVDFLYENAGKTQQK
jgi:mono/diheme cytochrome c family protein